MMIGFIIMQKITELVRLNLMHCSLFISLINLFRLITQWAKNGKIVHTIIKVPQFKILS